MAQQSNVLPTDTQGITEGKNYMDTAYLRDIGKDKDSKTRRMVVQVPPHDAVLLKSLNQGSKKWASSNTLRLFHSSGTCTTVSGWTPCYVALGQRTSYNHKHCRGTTCKTPVQRALFDPPIYLFDKGRHPLTYIGLKFRMLQLQLLKVLGYIHGSKK